MDPKSVAVDAARNINYRLHAEQLNIPIVKGFQLQKDENPQTIIFAAGQGITEQLVSDGYIEDGKFNERIELVIANTKEFMKTYNCEKIEDSFIYFKDYSNGIFEYKLYFQDMIIPLESGKVVLRSLNAYFVEPKMHDFYQLSVTMGPFNLPTEFLKVGQIDLENDKITKTLDIIMIGLLDNLKYR